jgi:hypothetical protein
MLSVLLNVSDNFEWVLQSIGYLSVQPFGPELTAEGVFSVQGVTGAMNGRRVFPEH